MGWGGKRKVCRPHDAGRPERFAAPRRLGPNLPQLMASRMKALPLVVLLASSLLSQAAAPTPPQPTHPAAAPATQTVTVVVTALASPQSVVRLNFYHDPATFLKHGQQAFRLEVKPEGKTELSVPVELAPGEWAVALTQDTNNNDKLDKNMLGIPSEPYAFSNNVRPHLAAPSFEECKFTVGGPGLVVRIALKD
ncbi:MAG: DUF2141 domain-containing protein [Hymenobacter sp.]|nr:MAG: DUF2141 domain-containing protein [Hymenobacter sp.]